MNMDLRFSSILVLGGLGRSRELSVIRPLSHLHPFPSILGMHIFGCKFSLRTDTGDTVPDRKNFDSLLWAIVTVFQVSGIRKLMDCRGKTSR